MIRATRAPVDRIQDDHPPRLDLGLLVRGEHDRGHNDERDHQEPPRNDDRNRAHDLCSVPVAV
jgi:hypothetical protein